MYIDIIYSIQYFTLQITKRKTFNNYHRGCKRRQLILNALRARCVRRVHCAVSLYNDYLCVVSVSQGCDGPSFTPDMYIPIPTRA